MHESHEDVVAHVRHTVEAHVSFPTVDQLHEAVARLAEQRPGNRIRQIGNSRLGWPLSLLSIGSGVRHALIIGGPHANEPVGFHTVLALASLIGESPGLTEGWTWHFIPVLDLDAARLNTWYAEPLTVRGYYRGLYRPAADRQPGYTFPIPGGGFDRPLPETWALMRVIDELGPGLELVVELHNAEFAGPWFVVNRRSGALADALRSVVSQAGMRVAEVTSSCVGWETDGPGVFIEPATAPYTRANAPYGASLNQHLSRATLAIAPEVPLWSTNLPQPPPAGARHGLMQVADEMAASVEILSNWIAALAADLTIRPPFQPGALMMLDYGRQLATRDREPAGDVSADDYTAAAYALHMVRMRAAGMLLRTLRAERAVGQETPAIWRAAARLDEQLEDWCAGFEATFAPVPFAIERSVQVQVHAALLAARHLDEVHEA